MKDKVFPRTDVIMELLKLFPGLNGHWLVMGEGEMWLPESRQFRSPNDPGYGAEVVKQNNLRQLKQDVAFYQERVKTLESQLADKEELLQLYREKYRQE